MSEGREAPGPEPAAEPRAGPATDDEASEAEGSLAAADASADAPESTDLFRRLLAFQLKLLIDGLRDVVLSPASIIAVLFGVFGDGPADRPFRALLRFGRRTDEWIDLFDAHEGRRAPEAERPEASANALFDAVERAVREEYERGGGRSAIEARLRALRARRTDGQ